MNVLNHRSVVQKVRRIAYEIIEQNPKEKIIYLAGINTNGTRFAQMLLEELEKLRDIDFRMIQIKLNPANPISENVEVSVDEAELKNKIVIVIDDVANTGRTAFYAMKPLLKTLTKKIQVAVLVDRTHKSFPIHVDYVGLSLATTVQQDIEVHIEGKEHSVRLN